MVHAYQYLPVSIMKSPRRKSAKIEQDYSEVIRNPCLFLQALTRENSGSGIYITWPMIDRPLSFDSMGF